MLLIGQKQHTEQFFDFNKTIDGHWLEPSLWSNPLQDWKIEDGKAHCEVSGNVREICILNKEVNEKTGFIEIEYEFQTLFKEELGLKKDYSFIGFEIGKKDLFEGYQAAAVFGLGLKIGLNLNGELFIDKQKKKAISDFPKPDTHYKIRLNILKDVDATTISLSLYQNGEEVSYLEERFSIDVLHGQISLMAHLIKDEMPLEGIRERSLSIDNLSIKSSESFHFAERQFGPIVFSKYLVQPDRLKLSVQFVPRIDLSRSVSLEIKQNNQWTKIADANISEENYNTLFDIPYQKNETFPYRISYTFENNIYFDEGIIKPYCQKKDSLVLGGISCIYHYGFPHKDIIENVKSHQPDLLFFAGDQIYETGLEYGLLDHRFPESLSRLDYFYKWFQFGWAFKDLLQHYPSILLTDDHDVFQPNLWGALGQELNKEEKKEARHGGYLLSSDFVNMTESTQTNHLPETKGQAVDGINTYYTNYEFGGIDFAILEDRKFKSAPPKYKNLPKIADSKNYQLVKEKAKQLDKEKLELLGSQQENFLNKWSENWSTNTWLKVVLSQTPLTQIHQDHSRVIPERNQYPQTTYAWDFDTNGWPQSKRNKTLEILKKCAAFHICGDQHLGMSFQYGIDKWKDAVNGISIPAASNTYARSWFPPDYQKKKKIADRPIGNFKDSFNNYFTVKAVFNPKQYNFKPSKLHNKAPGYAIIKFFQATQNIESSVYKRGYGLNSEYNNKPMRGWPVKVKRIDNFGNTANFSLPFIRLNERFDHLVKISDMNGKVLRSFIPHKKLIVIKMDEAGTYKLEIIGEDFYRAYEVEALEGMNKQMIDVGVE